MVTFPFQDSTLPFAARVDDLVSRLSLAEKAAQMLHEAPAIPRLGVPAYNWWNECVHGVARAGIATVFPQAIGLAAMWSTERMGEVATAIADEARAKHHEFLRKGDHGIYKGLTFWSPNINIFRDPRWGRGHETYGECPYLTGRLAVAFCSALQETRGGYLKLVATPKHYAVHSGPEGLRHSFDAVVSEKDLRETYLPAFRACVREANARSVMTAYNRTNGEPCSASTTLIGRILREEWKFDGYVVSDCWAIKDLHEGHKVTTSCEESAAMAVRAGCDLNCGCTYEHIPKAVETGLLDERDVDVCVKRLFLARMQLGMFDPPEKVPFASVPYETNASEAHGRLTLQAARESIVLLKNTGGLLPLAKDVGSIAVIGPNAADAEVLHANYFGVMTRVVTPLDGIREHVAPATKITYTDGCKRLGTKTDGLGRAGNLSEALSVAERADVVVLCLGLSADIEGEQGDAGNSEAAGDKVDLRLTGLQQTMLEQVVSLGKPTVLVVVSGSPLDLTWAHDHVGAIVQAFYPGEQGGTAIADVLFGDYSPGGRLPVTYPRRVVDLPPFADYAMKGRTYRYLEHEPLYPFGYGLSYTTFRYSEIATSKSSLAAGESFSVSAEVKNTGSRAGDEVVQLYVEDAESSCVIPTRELRGFTRVALAPGEARRVTFSLSPRDLSLIDAGGRRVLEPGLFRLFVGGSQPDARSAALTGTRPLSVDIEVTGSPLSLEY